MNSKPVFINEAKPGQRMNQARAAIYDDILAFLPFERMDFPGNVFLDKPCVVPCHGFQRLRKDDFGKRIHLLRKNGIVLHSLVGPILDKELIGSSAEQKGVQGSEL